MDNADAIIISDIHLGSDVSQARLLTDFLEKVDNENLTKRLILNGDFFDNMDFRRLKKYHWKVLSAIRSMSDHIKVVLILGNHDGPAEVLSHLLGMEFLEEYVFESGGKKILALHGDRFDGVITDRPVLVYFADKIYKLIQKIDKSFYLAKLAKKSSKTFLRNAEVIEKKSTEYMRKIGCDMVCCGHVHYATANPPTGYYNSGSWTELPCNYLVVKDGKIDLFGFSSAESPCET
jgi:UDP-2,3-diacylglucosamine pyrophosphatase LpxH